MPSRPDSAVQALRRRVRATIRDRELFSGARALVVGCSGGPDSQALLHVLHALRDEHRCELVPAGVDHRLRVEAHDELGLAQQLASKLSLPFIRLAVDVPAGAALQANARRARYGALLACAAAHGAAHVAVGHTLDDQAETVLARLLRGTGLEGLSAIDPRRPDGVVRPLLDAERSLVHAYVEELGLAHAQDPSNRDARFLRVRIRHRLLPALARESPGLSTRLAHLADDAREGAAVLQSQADALLAEVKGGARGLAPLREAKGPIRRRALRRWAELEAGVVLQRHHIVALERMLSIGGEVRLPGGIVAALDPASGMIWRPVSKRGRGQRRRKEETDVASD